MVNILGWAVHTRFEATITYLKAATEEPTDVGKKKLKHINSTHNN